MKKFFVTLGIATCVFGLTACSTPQVPDRIKGEAVGSDIESTLISYGEQEVTQIEQIVSSGQEELAKDDLVYGPAIESFKNAEDDLGSIEGFLQDAEYVVETAKDEYTVNIGVDGSDHDADVQVTYTVNNNQLAAKSITTNVRYSFAELMEQAGLNTLLGMGTTFAVLIILALLISCFKFIPSLQKAFSKKKEQAPAAEPVAEPAAAVAPAAEEVSDDGELVAVIAAAIAASEGRETTDGFVVRSIRKSRKRF